MPEVLVDDQTDVDVRIAPRWRVLLHNDDVHSFEFVIIVIVSVFRMNAQEAMIKTIEIHNEGCSTIITCSKERAELYLEQVAGMREGQLGPVSASIEPE